MSDINQKVTVRKQKIRKNHVRAKLIFFTILVLILLVIAAFARKLCPYDPDIQDLLMAQKPPSAEHIMGTDRYGRDMFSRVLSGSTTSIYATLLLVAIVTVVGTTIGIICGWCGGIADTILMRISDLFLAFPSSSRRAWRGNPECDHSSCGDRMAEVCQTCQRPDACPERFSVSDGSKIIRKQYVQDHVQAYFAEHCRPHTGDLCS